MNPQDAAHGYPVWYSVALLFIDVGTGSLGGMQTNVPDVLQHMLGKMREVLFNFYEW